jgi:hypothetical protein
MGVVEEGAVRPPDIASGECRRREVDSAEALQLVLAIWLRENRRGEQQEND